MMRFNSRSRSASHTLQPHVPAPAAPRIRGLRPHACMHPGCNPVYPRSNLLRPAAEQPAAAAAAASATRASKYKWLRPAARGEVGVAVGIVMDGAAPPPPPPLARASSCGRSSSNPRRATSLVRRGQKYEERLSRARNSAAVSQRRSIEGKRCVLLHRVAARVALWVALWAAVWAATWLATWAATRPRGVAVYPPPAACACACMWLRYRRESEAAAAGCRRAQQQVYAAGGFRTTVCLGAHVMCTAARMHAYCSLGACDCSLNACMGVAWAYRPATLGVPPCNPRRQKW